MATSPPPTPAPPAPSGGGGGNKILLGCGIGCGAILLLALIAIGVFWVKVAKPMAEAIEQVEQVQKDNQAATEAIAALDGSYPSSIGEDLDGAVLSAAQLDSYIAVRTALGPQAEAVAQARESLASSFDMGKLASGGTASMGAMFDMMGGMFGGMRDQELARGELLKAAQTELDAASIGPAELSAILEIVEWRFLQQEAALPTALTPSERSDWLQKRWQANFSKSILDGAGSQMGSSDRAQMERSLEEAEERLDDLRALAEERTVLSDATRALLESRRADLQNLPAPGLMELSMLTENPNPMEGMEGLGGF